MTIDFFSWAKLKQRSTGGRAAGDVQTLSERSAPSSLVQVRLCAAVPMQAKSWIAVPFSLFAPASSMHLPVAPRIGPAPRYFAVTTDGLSTL
jgi:hypothetical protein